MASYLPPRRKNWKPGKYQIGFFLRAPDGSTLEFTNNDPSKKVIKQAALLVMEALAPDELNGLRSKKDKNGS